MYIPPEKKCHFHEIENNRVFCGLVDKNHDISLEFCENKCEIGAIYRKCNCSYISGNVQIGIGGEWTGKITSAKPICSDKGKKVTIDYCINCEECKPEK